MATGTSFYDVVIFGTDLEGVEREQAKQKLAELCQCAPEEAERLLQTKGVPVKQRATTEEARRLQQQLLHLGIQCNYRPSLGSGHTLALVPEEEEDPPIVCPACGHNHRPAPGTPKPGLCEKCGVVFSKFERVSAAKLEREQIRRRLMEKHQRQIEERAAEQKKREEEARRRRLEEEIRKELGLPRFIASRRGVISSAAVIFGLGLSLGAGTVYLTQQEWKASRQDAGLPAGVDARWDPAVLAHLQAQTLLDGTPGILDRLRAAGSSKTPDAPATPAKRNLLALMLDELHGDAEWDLFLASRMEILLGKGALPVALELAEHLHRPQFRIGRGARLAEDLMKQGKKPEAEKLFNRLTNVAETLRAGEAARVEALCEIARHQASPDTTLATAQLIAGRITVPSAKAVAETEVGAVQANLGRQEEARAAFSRANQAIGQIADPAERLLAVARMARGYARAGSRGGAASLLEDVMNGLGALPEGDRRNAVLAEVMQSYSQLGDIQSALQAADRIGTAMDRDQALHGLVVAAITSGHLAQAMEAAEAIKTPAYQARALGLLGLAQRDQPNYRMLAPASFERARQFAGSIVNPAERLAVTAELARFAARDPGSRMADQYFADAESLTASLRAAPDSDPALAVLAANQARGLRAAHADKTLAEIRDPALVQAVTQDLAEVKEAASLAGQ